MSDHDKKKVAHRPLPPMSPYPLPDSDKDRADPNVPKGTDLFYFVLDRMDEGENRSEIRTRLAAFGYSAENAERITGDIADRLRYYQLEQEQERATPKSDRGRRDKLIGGSIFVLGAFVTVTSALISEIRGGSSVIAFGAMIWGGIQFYHGLLQSERS